MTSSLFRIFFSITWSLGLLSASSLLHAKGVATSSNEGQVPQLVIEVRAKNSKERTLLGNLGFALEEIRSDRVFVYGFESDLKRIQAAGFEASAQPLKSEWLNMESADSTKLSRYHSYAEVQQLLTQLTLDKPHIASLSSLGRSVESREMPLLRISGKSLGEAEGQRTPVIFYMGCHHAREHLSVEVPLMYAQYLVQEYGSNPDVTRLVDSREIYIAPIINPDGHIHDYSDGIRGRMWRKNRNPNSNNTFGVDLNRNYDWGWGGEGSSGRPADDTYRGTGPFSEPESRAVRDFVNSQPRMTTLLSMHSYSELILYPWSGSYQEIGPGGGNAEDLPVFKKMARTMASWNHYTPQQSSDLYISTGDTADWAYGSHGIFAFTFELSPSSQWNGGFYPAPSIVESAFQNNLQPLMYLLEYSDNPHRVMQERARPNFSLSPTKKGISLASFADMRL